VTFVTPPATSQVDSRPAILQIFTRLRFVLCFFGHVSSACICFSSPFSCKCCHRVGTGSLLATPQFWLKWFA